MSRNSSGAIAAFILFFGFLAHPNGAALAATAGVTGTWAGVLGGEKGLHILLTIAQADTGKFTAEINSVDQGSVFQADSVSVADRTLGFEIRSIGGVYQGTLNESDTEIGGTWKQGKVPAQPLTFKRATDIKAAAPEVLPGPKEKPISIPLDVLVPKPPTAFTADGKVHLVYELHVTNMSSWNCVLSSLEVVSGEEQHLAKFSQADLDGMIRQFGPKLAVKSEIGAGKTVVVFVWVTLEGSGEKNVPATLRHHLSVKLGDYPEVLELETRAISVVPYPLVISAPLSGDHWVAANGPSNTSGHRRALISTQGGAMIAQRFAIDWVRVDESGMTYKGDPLDNKNYYAYGADVLAVGDGVVAEVQDGVPLNIPGVNSRAVPITLENIGGNHVVLDLGKGHYAFYAHLQPGSLRVKLGDKVRRGQVLGLVGNTGNSTEPHLHFHLADAVAPLGAEGLPYALTSFDLLGHATDNGLDTQSAPRNQKKALPEEGEVIKFVLP